MEWCELYGRFLVVKLKGHPPVVFNLKKILMYRTRSQEVAVNISEIQKALRDRKIWLDDKEAEQLFETALHDAKVIYPWDVDEEELAKKYGIPYSEIRTAWDGVEVEEEVGE